jgi:tetratricopeptide (TPR) repeat protein
MKYKLKRNVYSAIAALVVLAKPICAMDQKSVLEQKSQNLGSSHAFTEEGKLNELMETCEKRNQSLIKDTLYFYKKSQFGKAIEILKKAELREPKNEIVHFSLALCYSAKQDYTNAIKHCLLSDQRDLYLQCILGISYAMGDKNEKAIEHLLQSDQNNQIVLLSLGGCYAKQGNLSESMKCMQKASASPEMQQILDPVISDINKTLEKSEQEPQALEENSFLELIKKAEAAGSPEASIELGKLYMKQYSFYQKHSKYKEASDCLIKAVKKGNLEAILIAVLITKEFE